MVSGYGASPYRHVPVEFSNDRAIRRVKPMWQNTSSVYGPLWNGISAGVVSVTHTSSQSTRMWFQSLAALSGFLAVLLIARVQIGKAHVCTPVPLEPPIPPSPL